MDVIEKFRKEKVIMQILTKLLFLRLCNYKTFFFNSNILTWTCMCKTLMCSYLP